MMFRIPAHEYLSDVELERQRTGEREGEHGDESGGRHALGSILVAQSRARHFEEVFHLHHQTGQRQRKERQYQTFIRGERTDAEQHGAHGNEQCVQYTLAAANHAHDSGNHRHRDHLRQNLQEPGTGHLGYDQPAESPQ